MGRTVHVVQADQLHPQPIPGIKMRAPQVKPAGGQVIIGYMLHPAQPGVMARFVNTIISSINYCTAAC